MLATRYNSTFSADNSAMFNPPSTNAWGVLNVLPFGVAVVNSRARVLFANGPARRIFASNGALSANGNVLCARSPIHGRALANGIEELSCNPDAQPIGFRLGGPETAPLLTMLCRMPEQEDQAMSGGPTPVIVTMWDCEKHDEPDPKLLRSLFGFTRAESAVASLMMQANDTAEIAARLNISGYTVRNHLKHMFSKTGARSQPQLLYTLMRSPVSLTPAARGRSQAAVITS